MPTSIQWTDETWNPTRGCSRVSEGCRNCYAERQAARFARPSNGHDIENGPFYGFVHQVNGHPAWTGKVELIESKLSEPLRWKKPRRVFVNSMSDLFHEALPYGVIRKVLEIIRLADWHTFQVVTKRAARMREVMQRYYDEMIDVLGPHPIPNLWLIVSVEDQPNADLRLPHLLSTFAAIRGVSYEPALGPVDFFTAPWTITQGNIHWVIVGGESGPGARPFDIAWARKTVEQCKAVSVAVFCKQLGADPIVQVDNLEGWHDISNFRMTVHQREMHIELNDRKGGDMDEWPEDLRVREFPQVEGA